MSSIGVISSPAVKPALVWFAREGTIVLRSNPSGRDPDNELNTSPTIESATPARAPSARSRESICRELLNWLIKLELISPAFTWPLSAPTNSSLAAVPIASFNLPLSCPVISPTPGISPSASEIWDSNIAVLSLRTSVSWDPTCSPKTVVIALRPSPEATDSNPDFKASLRLILKSVPGILSSDNESGKSILSARPPVISSNDGGKPPEAIDFNSPPTSTLNLSPLIGNSVFKLYKAPLFKALSIFFADSMMVDLPAGAPVLTVGVSTSPFPSKLGNSPDANAASTPDFGCSGSKCSVFSIWPSIIYWPWV